jgi:hypothetical protein
MTLRDWLRHPLRCLYAVWDGRVHADCRGRIEITPKGREALSDAPTALHVYSRHVHGSGASHGRSHRLADIQPGGRSAPGVRGARDLDDTAPFPAPFPLP